MTPSPADTPTMQAFLDEARAAVFGSRRRLRECPHCGETEELYLAYHDMGGEPYAVDCLGCGADFTPREGLDVVAMWNRRDPPKTRDEPRMKPTRRGDDWVEVPMLVTIDNTTGRIVRERPYPTGEAL